MPSYPTRESLPMTDSTQPDGVGRREYMRGAAAAGLAGTTLFAGCLTGGDGGGDGGSEVEVLHGWTGGDGADAADALFTAFEEEHSDVPTNVRPIGGEGNQALDQVVAQRLQSDEPPSSFAGWPGPNMLQYEGVLGDVEEEVWDEAGLKDAHAPEVVEICQGPDGYSAVPIGSHRMNDLFYNVSVIEEAGVDPDSIDSFDALVSAMDAIESETNATPYVNTMQSWTVLQFWAVNMLGSQGYEAYMNFIEGNGDREQVRAAFDNAEVILSEYINGDAPEIGFTEANQRIMAGDAGFIHQGNWVAGAYGDDFVFGEDWDRIQYPGTENMYGLHFDSFLYPADNPSADNTHTFLQFVGSETAHIEFNRLKGSIPTREVPTDRFNPYLTETIEDFNSAERRPPTLAHGLAVPQSTQSELETAITNNFADPFDAEAATNQFMNIV